MAMFPETFPTIKKYPGNVLETYKMLLLFEQHLWEKQRYCLHVLLPLSLSSPVWPNFRFVNMMPSKFVYYRRLVHIFPSVLGAENWPQHS